MANMEKKFTDAHKSMRVEVTTKIQRKNASIHRSAKWAAKRMYKEIRPTLVMHLVRGNSVFFKLDESLELLIYIATDRNPFGPDNSANPTIKMACPHRKKRGKLIKEDRELFDRIYSEELSHYFNIEALDKEEYRKLNV